MQTNKWLFKTNINCQNCLAAVAPFLNQDLDIEAWEVDLESPDRVLTVEGTGPAEKIESLVTKAGFKASILDNKAF